MFLWNHSTLDSHLRNMGSQRRVWGCTRGLGKGDQKQGAANCNHSSGREWGDQHSGSGCARQSQEGMFSRTRNGRPREKRGGWRWRWTPGARSGAASSLRCPLGHPSRQKRNRVLGVRIKRTGCEDRPNGLSREEKYKTGNL